MQRQTLDTHLAPSSSSGMRSLRGLSYGLRTAIAHPGSSSSSSSCAAAHLSATGRQLQHSNARLPTGLLVGGQHRACTAAAATTSDSPTADDAGAEQLQSGSLETKESAGSSSSNGVGSRAVNEHIAAAASATAPAPAAVSAGRASSSISISRRTVGPPRFGPQRRLPGSRLGLPPRAAGTAAPLRPAAPPSEAIADATSSSSSSSSSSNGSSSTGSSSSSSTPYQFTSWDTYRQQQQQQQLWLNRDMKLSDIDTIRDRGLTGLREWSFLQRAWPGLQQQWEEAQQQMPPAMERLLSVSQSGDVKVVFFDTETTGFGIAEIIELAAATADGQTFPQAGGSTLMRPLSEISPEATRNAHGMVNSDLIGQPCAPVVLLQWLDWLTQQCQAAPGGSCRLVLAGHNVGFDERLVAYWFRALRLERHLVTSAQGAALGWKGQRAHLPWLCLDTKPLADKYYDALKGNPSLHSSKLESAKLQDLKPHFGVTVEGPAHRALPDVLVNQAVFRHLMHWKLGLQQGQDSSHADLDTLAVQYLAGLPQGKLLKQQQQQQKQPVQTRQQPPGRPAGASKLSMGQQLQQQPPPPQQQQPPQPPQPSQPPQQPLQQQPQPSPPLPPQAQQQDEHASDDNEFLDGPLDGPYVEWNFKDMAERLQGLYADAAAALEVGDMARWQDLRAKTVLLQHALIELGDDFAAEQQQAAAKAAAEARSSTTGRSDVALGSSEASSSEYSSGGGGSSFGAAAGSAASSSPSSASSGSNASSGSSASSSSKAGWERGGGSNIQLESSGNMPPLDPQVVERAVAAGLESLAAQDLTWDPQQLSQAWPLLGDPLNPRDKIVSAGLYSKLLDAGFNNHLQVLQQAPTVVKYHDSVPVDASSSSSSDTEAGLSEDSTDGAEGVAGDSRPFVFFNNAKVLAVTQPCLSRATNGAVWGAVLQAPANPPSAGPVAVLYTMFQPGSKSWVHGAVKQVMQGPYKQAYEAAVNGTDVLFKGRLKRHIPGDKTYVQQWQPQDPAIPITWEVASSTPAAEVSWDGSDSLSVSTAEGGEVLEPRYDRKGLSSEDWLGSGRSSGIIGPLLSAVRERGMQDILPDSLRQQYEIGSWLEDLQEVHRPTSEQQYQRACKGIAMRELVLMQVAQFLERYRVTTTPPEGVIAAVNELLLPRPLTAAAEGDDSSSSSSSTSGATVAAGAKPKRAAGKKSSKRASGATAGASAVAAAGGNSTSSIGSSNGSSSSSDEESSSRTRPVRLMQPGEAVQRGVAAFSVSNPDAVQKARRELVSTYGWDLTEDQERVLQEVQADLKGPRAMLRLLQGDVGCGKTMVALLACLETAASGYQALLFAPTELLATQHYKTVEKLTEELPMGVRPRIGILTGSLTAAAKRDFKQEIAAGRLNIIISTQAALYVDAWDKLALVVIDEQHKMGVKQRERLTRRVEAPPHMLLMTATPIPRTLAIMQYGGMSLSTINQLPPGRAPVETHVVQDDDLGRQQVYAAIQQEIASGGRAYIVCPLVSESDSDAMAGVRTVEEEYARLSGSGIFGDGSECGKLHGKMSADEKRDVLESFRRGDTHVLIASTVVEVGVDVSEASVMLVEAANRFGLAQLHQLRGRVGRGSKASRCYLMAPAGDAAATERLQELEKSHNGLHIAEADLRIRGPGDLWSGTKQSGKSSHLSPITMRQLQADPHIMEHARLAAAQLLLNVSQDTAVKAALLASGIMELRSGQQLPVARYGISGM